MNLKVIMNLITFLLIFILQYCFVLKDCEGSVNEKSIYNDDDFCSDIPESFTTDWKECPKSKYMSENDLNQCYLKKYQQIQEGNYIP